MLISIPLRPASFSGKAIKVQGFNYGLSSFFDGIQKCNHTSD